MAVARGTSDQAEVQRLSTVHGTSIYMNNTQRNVSIMLDDHTSAQLPSLSLERVDRIHPAIGVGAGCGSDALVIGRELAIARISPSTPPQAIMSCRAGGTYDRPR